MDATRRPPARRVRRALRPSEGVSNDLLAESRQRQVRKRAMPRWKVILARSPSWRSMATTRQPSSRASFRATSSGSAEACERPRAELPPAGCSPTWSSGAPAPTPRTDSGRHHFRRLPPSSRNAWDVRARSRVTLSDATPGIARFGVGGLARAHEAVHAALGAAPAPFTVTRHGNGCAGGTGRAIVAAKAGRREGGHAGAARRTRPTRAARGVAVHHPLGVPDHHRGHA